MNTKNSIPANTFNIFRVLALVSGALYSIFGYTNYYLLSIESMAILKQRIAISLVFFVSVFLTF